MSSCMQRCCSPWVWLTACVRPHHRSWTAIHSHWSPWWYYACCHTYTYNFRWRLRCLRSNPRRHIRMTAHRGWSGWPPPRLRRCYTYMPHKVPWSAKDRQTAPHYSSAYTNNTHSPRWSPTVYSEQSEPQQIAIRPRYPDWMHRCHTEYFRRCTSIWQKSGTWLSHFLRSESIVHAPNRRAKTCLFLPVLPWALTAVSVDIVPANCARPGSATRVPMIRCVVVPCKRRWPSPYCCHSRSHSAPACPVQIRRYWRS